MNSNFLYATDNAGPLLTFDGEYRLRHHRDHELVRRTARVLRAIARRLPRLRVAATSR